MPNIGDDHAHQPGGEHGNAAGQGQNGLGGLPPWAVAELEMVMAASVVVTRCIAGGGRAIGRQGIAKRLDGPLDGGKGNVVMGDVERASSIAGADFGNAGDATDGVFDLGGTGAAIHTAHAVSGSGCLCHVVSFQSVDRDKLTSIATRGARPKEQVFRV